MDRSAAREPRPNPYVGARAFLDKHAPTLAEQAWARIAASEADYGDSYLWTARRQLVAELSEELVDGTAWAALIAEPPALRRRGHDDSESTRHRAAHRNRRTPRDADRLVARLHPLLD